MMRIKSNHRPFHRDLDRMEHQPDAKMIGKLDIILESGFVSVQNATHIDTGALLASLRKRSSVNKAAKTWRGKITAGGIGGVDYAIYEQKRGVGGAGGPSDAKGDHDFMRPLSAMELKILKTLTGGL